MLAVSYVVKLIQDTRRNRLCQFLRCAVPYYQYVSFLLAHRENMVRAIIKAQQDLATAKAAHAAVKNAAGSNAALVTWAKTSTSIALHRSERLRFDAAWLGKLGFLFAPMVRDGDAVGA